MHEIDLSKYNIHTDLIIENNEAIHNEETIDNLTITKTQKDGNYITLTFEDITDNINYLKVSHKLTILLKEILEINNINKDSSCLVIGLGNRKSTPDSLGVKVLDDITITSHILAIDKNRNIRKISAFTPGVMASTGIESSMIIKALIDKVKPDFVIAIDALASRNIERLNKTIQITDTGIHPGSGIGNNRLEISNKTMHIPIIAIGVPTVVLSSTIVADTIDYLYKHISYIKENEALNKLTYQNRNYKDKLKNKSLTNNEKQNLLGLFGTLSEIEQYNLINEVLDKTELNLIVTPTEIDFIIDKLSKLIAESINNVLIDK